MIPALAAHPPCRRERTFVIALVAAYAVAVGQGFILPFLPGLLQRIGTGGTAERAGQVGLVMVAFFAGGLFTASLWGWLSDRFGRRRVLLAGMIGFAVTLALTAAQTSLPGLYLLRVLNGAFSVAVVPVALAVVADQFPDGAIRGRRFAWLNAAVVAGYLSGPLLGELVVNAGRDWPFYAPALLAAGAAIPVLLLPRTAPVRIAVQRAAAEPPRRRGLGLLLAVSATAAGGLAATEVFVAMAPEARGLTRQSVSLLFGLCALLMLAAQLLQFRTSHDRQHATRLPRAMLALEAMALAATSFADGFWGFAVTISVLAWSTATLLLFSSYLVSRLTPAAQGLGLGLQYAAVAGGQLLGSMLVGGLAGTGGIVALWLFAAAAGLLCLGANRLASGSQP
ncbi:MAG TPA: MFS transporter [Caulobacter sp.]|nr:MFS transporter [Caulobacter sp.]